MLRDVTIIGAAVLALQILSPGAKASSASESRRADARFHVMEVRLHQAHQRRAQLVRAEPVRTQETMNSSAISRTPAPMSIPAPEPTGVAPWSLSYQIPSTVTELLRGSASQGPQVLTDQESQVGRMAAASGDRTFLMVDKALGRIILFQNGTATFSAAALTGQSMGDTLPPNAQGESMDALSALDTKVTPAGRYTVVRNFVKEYGQVLDVKEIRGKDWGIAIHRVYLGTPSEHRPARLASPSPEVKHITFGCINVAPTTLDVLLNSLPDTGPTPLYILPEDPTQTTTYFSTARTS